MKDTRPEPTGKRLPLDQIRTDGGTQPRETISQATVIEYASAIADGAEFVPVVVYFDGTDYWLSDGFHRVAAHREASVATIAVDVRQGTRRDAVLHAAGANAQHGLRRSSADKRRAVMLLLLDPEWAKLSDREISRKCFVSHNFVSETRKNLTVINDSENAPAGRTYTTKHGTPATMNTSNIGKTNAAAPVMEEGDVDEPLPVPVATSATAKPLDEVGRVIEHVDVAAAFGSRPLFKELMREVSALKAKYAALLNIPGGRFACEFQKQFDADVNNLHSTLRFAMPYAICPLCGGMKCTQCKYVGYAPEKTYTRLLALMRGEGGGDVA